MMILAWGWYNRPLHMAFTAYCYLEASIVSAYASVDRIGLSLT